MLLLLLYIAFLFNAYFCSNDGLLALKASSVIEYGLERLSAIENSPDNCFKRTSVELYRECPTMDFHSIKNMKYAVLLSICEFKMVGAKLPKECDEKLFTETRKIKTCAKMLSGGAQTWTTYNGYFKDIGMICFSIRYPIEKGLVDFFVIPRIPTNTTLYIEAISLLYGNISAVQLETSNILKEQQKYLIEWRHEEIAHLENIVNMQRKVTNQSKIIKKLMNETATQLGDYFDILLVLQEQTESGLERQNKEIQLYVDEARIQLDKLAYEKDQSIAAIFELLTNEVKTINSQMSEMDNLQTDSLKQWTEIKEVQEKYIIEWKQSIRVVDSCIQSVLAYTLQEVQTTEKNLNNIHAQLEDTFFWIGWIKSISRQFYRVIEFLLLHALFWYHVVGLFAYFRIRIKFLILTFLLSSLFTPFSIKTFFNKYTPFVSALLAVYRWASLRVREQQQNNQNDDEDDGGSFRPPSPSTQSSLSSFSVHNSDSLSDEDDSDDRVPMTPFDNEPPPLHITSPQLVPYRERKMITQMILPVQEFNKYYFHRYYGYNVFGQQA